MTSHHCKAKAEAKTPPKIQRFSEKLTASPGCISYITCKKLQQGREIQQMRTNVVISQRESTGRKCSLWQGHLGNGGQGNCQIFIFAVFAETCFG